MADAKLATKKRLVRTRAKTGRKLPKAAEDYKFK
jgi:hypothetical protein